MSFHNQPTFRGPGKAKPLQTRTPVGRLGSKFNNIPRAGKLSVPLFGDRPKPIEQMKANTPAFRGPAKLPSGFLKNIPTGNFSQTRNPMAELFNGPLFRGVPRVGLHGVPRAGHKKSVTRKTKKKTQRKK